MHCEQFWPCTSNRWKYYLHVEC
uniref:Uncharacterized protein n=1 Tax=Arundo donax TaxID=35708 RepID=A0A0A9CC52_ARUDO